MNRAAESAIRGRRTLTDLQWLFRTLDDGPHDVVIVGGGLPYHSSLRGDIERTFAAAHASGTRVHAVEVADLTSDAFPEGGTQGAPTVRALDERYPLAYGLREETGGSDYIDVFQRTFSTMVLVERYVQLIRPWSGAPPMPLHDLADWVPGRRRSGRKAGAQSNRTGRATLSA